jgi:heme exporter protein CcmD
MTDSLAQWVFMGGLGVFVWPAYGVSALVIGALTISAWRRLKARQRELKSLQNGDGTR